MSFRFSREGLTGTDRLLQRLLELLPGAVSWTILLGVLSLAFLRPLYAAMLIIAFDLYWLLRLFYMTVFLVLSSSRLSIEQGTDWVQKIRRLEGSTDGLAALHEASVGRGVRQRLSRWIHERERRSLTRSGSPPPSAEDIYHVVIIPVVKEARHIVEPGIVSLARQTFSRRRILLVLALEQRAPMDVQAGVRELQAAYRATFLDVLVAVHPDDRLGEARVKGANVTHAAKEAGRVLRERGIGFERVIVSCFDADTVISPQYIACVTYHFMICPDRTRVSFQPIPVYHNNIWEAPGFARVLDIGASFFQLVEATNPEKLVTFSSHSMSFQALVEVGYWPVDMVSDDSAIFWKAFIHYQGQYRVIPMYVTVSMDVVSAGSWWKTVLHVYRQKRRWAWGVENVPIVLRAFLQTTTIPWSKKIRHGFKLLGGHVAWATWPLLLGAIGWLPAVFAGREFSSTVLYYSAPRITATIFSLSSVALCTTIVLSCWLLPKKPTAFSVFTTMGHACEWLLVPVIGVFLSALPALDAQTRLMVGRYMEFWVTDKRRPGLRRRPLRHARSFQPAR